LRVIGWLEIRALGVGAFLGGDPLADGVFEELLPILQIHTDILFEQLPILLGRIGYSRSPAKNGRNLPLGTWMWNLAWFRYH
jgi:hypothetical protein